MRKRRYCAVRFATFLLVALGGCATCREDRYAVQPLPPLPPPGGLVFVADGAGDFRCASAALSEAVAAEGLPVAVEPVLWSHGAWRLFADQLDLSYARKQGLRLARRVMACRAAYPDRPFYLVGHSAGCHVILAAAEALAPDTLERVILLAPSVPTDYDLRPALGHVHRGIDVYYSPVDGWYLRSALLLTSIMQAKWCTAAGTYGFNPQPRTPEDANLYTKLYQHPWGPWLAWAGHDGGHFGCYQQAYLRAFVLPQFVISR